MCWPCMHYLEGLWSWLRSSALVLCRLAVGSQPCGVPGKFASRAGGRCPSMSSCCVPDLPHGEELLKVCSREDPALQLSKDALEYDSIGSGKLWTQDCWLPQVCYTKGYNTGSSRQSEPPPSLGWQHLQQQLRDGATLTEPQNHHDSNVRSLVQVAYAGGDKDQAFGSGSTTDKTCLDYLVFVGSRGSLLQVCAFTVSSLQLATAS